MRLSSLAALALSLLFSVPNPAFAADSTASAALESASTATSSLNNEQPTDSPAAEAGPPQQDADPAPSAVENIDSFFNDHIAGPIFGILFANVLAPFQDDSVPDQLQQEHFDGTHVALLEPADGGDTLTITLIAAGDSFTDRSFADPQSDLGRALLSAGLGGTVEAPLAGTATATTTFAAMDRKHAGLPLIIFVLVGGGLFFTLRLGFINLRLFKHAIDCVRGKFDRPEDDGEISHFKALTAALSATVGLGNIAGVAVAIAVGGAGAVFWLWVAAFFGMSLKFTECTMAQLYRRIRPDGSVLGGPFVYLDSGFKEHLPGIAWLGKLFAIVAALFTIGASFGGGNMFQGKMTYVIANTVLDAEPDAASAWAFGIILAIMVAVVIIGGITRIANVTSKLVPTMCAGYCVVCLILIVVNVAHVPDMLGKIVADAFAPSAAFGGFLGVLVIGFQRAAFSNEAGLGSAAIAHSAAKTEEPVREGSVALLGPFIDTFIVCTMTALAILITDAHLQADQFAGINDTNLKGAQLTALAFMNLHESMSFFLMIAVFVFAYSTMISWSYYGERATLYLCGDRGVLPYRIIFCILVALGPVVSVGGILNFADAMLLSMALPNIIGLALLSHVIAKHARSYQQRLRGGEFHPVNESD